VDCRLACGNELVHPRTLTTWRLLAWFLIAFHFAVPFTVLLSRRAKRRRTWLAWIAALLLIANLVDALWLVVPDEHPQGLVLHWTDLFAPLGLGALWLCVFIGRAPARRVRASASLSTPHPAGMLMAELHPFGHEPTAIAARRVLWVGAVVAALVLIIIACCTGRAARHDPAVARLPREPPPSAAPRLQAHPHGDLVVLLRQQEALLSSYAWIDATHGTARIPIERAMAIYVQEQREKQATAPSTPSAMTQEPRQ